MRKIVQTSCDPVDYLPELQVSRKFDIPGKEKMRIVNIFIIAEINVAKVVRFILAKLTFHIYILQQQFMPINGLSN